MAGIARRMAMLQISKGGVSGLRPIASPAHSLELLRGYRRTIEMDDADLAGSPSGSSSSSSRGSGRPRSFNLEDSELAGTESISEWEKGPEREHIGNPHKEKCINQVTLLGRIGQDPQIRGSQSKPVTTFNLATNTSWRTEESPEWQSKTEWHRVAVFKPSLQDAVYNFLTKVLKMFR